MTQLDVEEKYWCYTACSDLRISEKSRVRMTVGKKYTVSASIYRSTHAIINKVLNTFCWIILRLDPRMCLCSTTEAVDEAFSTRPDSGFVFSSCSFQLIGQKVITKDISVCFKLRIFVLWMKFQNASKMRVNLIWALVAHVQLFRVSVLTL